MSRLSPVENPIGVIAESAPKRLRSPPNPLEVGCEPQSQAHFSLPPGPRYIVELSPDFSRFRTTQTSGLASGVRVQFLVENAFANVDAIVANVTPGPAMSLRTSAWLLPQKEHIVRLDALIRLNYSSYIIT